MPPPIRSSNPAVSGAAAGQGAARVVLVVNDPIRRRRMQELIQALAPQCLVEVVAGVLDGMARSTSMPAHLLVVDAAVDRPVMPTLVRYLARTAPLATVHVFDSLAGQPRNDSLDNSEEPPAAAAADDAEADSQALATLQAVLMSWLASTALPNVSPGA
jgi:hypothetical protein